ncbi:MAG TPA: CehA/McbA family metallohydrolase, partial [Thermomicrobiales bacterium]|nr:CehA/McbA family metallohydrolase [Thermomicrobiales bacterium]
ELAAAAYEVGFDFYGITDHNRAQSPVEFVPSGRGWPVLVPGVEVTTYAGHFNVWGTDTWYDFRDPTPAGIQAAIDAARADGGFVSLNHPKPFGPPWEYPELTGFDAIEPWNGWWNRLNDVSTRYWQERLTTGERVCGLGGSDMHYLGISGDADNPLSPAQMGMPTLWIQTDSPLSATSILEALRAGRSFISESPTGPQIFVQYDADLLRLAIDIVGAAGDALVVVADAGIVFAGAIASDSDAFSWDGDVLASLFNGSRFLRAEIHRLGGGIRALSQPIWL